MFCIFLASDDTQNFIYKLVIYIVFWEMYIKFTVQI